MHGRGSTWVSVLVATTLLFAACSIKQEVRPLRLAGGTGNVICIRNNPAVREGFLQAYRTRVESKGFTVRVLSPDAAVRSCSLTSTYTANWRWDLALYMAYAEILVYRDGEVIGRALYDSLGGGGRLDKFINATEKVNELVDQLFPS